MKFTIKIYTRADNGAETLLHRADVFSLNPLGARKRALRLLSEWKRHGAKGVHVLNAHAETVYELGE